MYKKMIIRGYDYGIDIQNDMHIVRKELIKEFEDRHLEPLDIGGIEYMDMLGSRLVISVPDEIYNDEQKSELVVQTMGKAIYDKYGMTYGIEIIPRDNAEYLIHLFRQAHDIEHTIISETKRIRKQKQVFDYIKTGYSKWDGYNCGLKKGRATVVYGLMAIGKTALAHNLINNICINHDKKCIFFSLAEDERRTRHRMMEICTGYSKRYSGTKKQMIMDMEEFRDSFTKWSIDSVTNIKIIEGIVDTENIRKICYQEKKIHRTDFAIIDYLQLVSLGNDSDAPNEPLLVLNEINLIAKEYDMAIVVLMNQRRNDSIPNLSGADLVVMNREDYANIDAEPYIDLDFYEGNEKKHSITLQREKNWKITDHIENSGEETNEFKV